MNKKALYESIMKQVSIEVKKALNEAEKKEEKELTPSEKIDAWMNGERDENIKACGPDKLRQYYKICKRKGFEEGMAEIEKVAKSKHVKLDESRHIGRFRFE